MTHQHHHTPNGRTCAVARATTLALALTLTIPTAALADPTSEELAQQREEIAAEREQIEAERHELEGALADAQEHLDQLGEEIAAIQQALMETEEALEITRNDIAETTTRIDETTAELADRRTMLGNHMRSSYKVGPSASLDTLLGATSFEDFINRVYYLDKISSAQAHDIETINQLERDLTAQRQQLEEVEATQQAKMDEIEAQAEEYEAKIAEARDYYDALGSEIQQKLAEEEEKRAEEAAKKAEEEAKRAEEEEARRKAEEEAVRKAEEERKAEEDRVRAEQAQQQTSNVTTAINAINEGNQEPVEAPAGSPDIVANAYQFIGMPYKKWWLGRNYGPDADGFDCCGLVCTAYHMAGYETPYQTPVAGLIDWVKSRGNWKDCDLGNIDQVLAPGDLVFCSYGHVALYIGNGMMIHAPVPGRYVCVAPVYACIGGGFGG